MAVYDYTGKLTDFGEAPFPEARPRLWVAPKGDAFSPSGPSASRGILVPVAGDGSFSVRLTASIDLVPETLYDLRCEWLAVDVAGVEWSRGWASWEFTAQPGGGDISTMPAVLTRVWYDTVPPPANRSGIVWVHPLTDDIKVWRG